MRGKYGDTSAPRSQRWVRDMRAFGKRTEIGLLRSQGDFWGVEPQKSRGAYLRNGKVSKIVPRPLQRVPFDCSAAVKGGFAICGLLVSEQRRGFCEAKAIFGASNPKNRGALTCEVGKSAKSSRAPSGAYRLTAPPQSKGSFFSPNSRVFVGVEPPKTWGENSSFTGQTERLSPQPPPPFSAC